MSFSEIPTSWKEANCSRNTVLEPVRARTILYNRFNNNHLQKELLRKSDGQQLFHLGLDRDDNAVWSVDEVLVVRSPHLERHYDARCDQMHPKRWAFVRSERVPELGGEKTVVPGDHWMRNCACCLVGRASTTRSTVGVASIVSRSRNSPTRRKSGSWRSTGRRAFSRFGMS